MQTTPDLVAAARAELFARLIYNDEGDEDARRALEHIERVVQVVGTHRQQAILWLRHLLNHEKVDPHVLVAFGFDSRLVDRADTLRMCPRESLRDYAKRLAVCQDSDVLSLAVAALDDRISQGIDDQPGTVAGYEEVRRILKRAADALAKRRLAEQPSAGGATDDRPTAPALRGALMALVEHTEGVQDAMMRMTTDPRNAPWKIRERLSFADLDLLVMSIHDLMQVVGALVIDMTARKTEDTSEAKGALFDAAKKGVPLSQAMETIARTIARRLRDSSEAYGGEGHEEGKIH